MASPTGLTLEHATAANDKAISEMKIEARIEKPELSLLFPLFAILGRDAREERRFVAKLCPPRWPITTPAATSPGVSNIPSIESNGYGSISNSD